jgi:prevent-host-death family protein
MQTVGIRELKAKLSEYLRRVQEGESISVTDRGKTIACITPDTEYPDLASYDGSSLVRDPGLSATIPPSQRIQKKPETYAALLKKAQKAGKHASEKETLTAALKEYIRRQNVEKVIAAFGTIDFDADWDYKKLRRIK